MKLDINLKPPIARHRCRKSNKRKRAYSCAVPVHVRMKFYYIKNVIALPLVQSSGTDIYHKLFENSIQYEDNRVGSHQVTILCFLKPTKQLSSLSFILLVDGNLSYRVININSEQ